MLSNIEKLECTLIKHGIKAYHTSEYPITNLICEVNGSTFEFTLLENDVCDWTRTLRKVLESIQKNI